MASKRSEFIEELFSKLDSVPVERVIGKRMELTRRGRHYLGLCPFHSDKKLGSFMVTPDKGVWKCYACGEGYGGDAVKFVSLYENKTYLEAAFDISLEEGVISQAEYDRYAHQKYEKTAIDRI